MRVHLIEQCDYSFLTGRINLFLSYDNENCALGHSVSHKSSRDLLTISILNHT